MLFMTQVAAELCTAPEVASWFSVSTQTVYRWARSGRLTARKLPGKTGAFVFDRSEVQQFAERRAVAAAAAVSAAYGDHTQVETAQPRAAS